MRELEDYVKLPGAVPPQDLVEKAVAAMGQAYSPYSSIQVGVALRLSTGEIFVGCNVENASYGATICAERVALSSAVVSVKRRPLNVIELVVVGRPGKSFSPCGICRQFIAELAPEAAVYFVNDDSWMCLSSSDVLPFAFGGEES